MAENLDVYRVGRNEATLIGLLGKNDGAFRYAESYLTGPHARPISFSLPLREEPFARAEAEPYFGGLVPEGAARQLMAAELHVRKDDYAAMLEYCGLDCVGDLAITPGPIPNHPSYEPMDIDELKALFAKRASMAELNGSERLSLAGTQSKVGLACFDESVRENAWLRAKGSAASTHILKVSSRDNISYFEFLCMRTASLLGMRVAETDLLDYGVPVLCSRRFDRLVAKDEDGYGVVRLHQEDFSQVFGIPSASKYVELNEGTLKSIARFLFENADSPVSDLRELAKLVCFNYAIGNCDNHLKNLSVLYGEQWAGLSLAPAYDLVCTTWFPNLSRNMGMAIDGVYDIDAVTPQNLRSCAKEMGVGAKAFSAIAHEIALNIEEAVGKARSYAPKSLDEVGWKADDLIEDMEPRLKVLSEV